MGKEENEAWLDKERFLWEVCYDSDIKICVTTKNLDYKEAVEKVSEVIIPTEGKKIITSIVYKHYIYGY